MEEHLEQYSENEPQNHRKKAEVLAGRFAVGACIGIPGVITSYLSDHEVALHDGLIPIGTAVIWTFLRTRSQD